MSTGRPRWLAPIAPLAASRAAASQTFGISGRQSSARRLATSDGQKLFAGPRARANCRIVRSMSAGSIAGATAPGASPVATG